MATLTAANVLASYLEGLDIHDDLNATFAFGTNLFIGQVIGTEDADESLTIKPDGGAAPITDRQEPLLTLIFRSTSRRKALGVMQALINNLHDNDLGGAGRMKAISSSPFQLTSTEGGENVLTLADFTIKHVKI